MPGPPIPVPIPSGLVGAPTPTPGAAIPTPYATPPPDPSGVAAGLSPEAAFTQWVQGAGQWVMPQLKLALGNGGATPGADWFVNPIYETMLGLGLAFAIPLMIVSLISSIRRGSLAQIAEMAMRLGLAVLISQFAIWVVVLLDNLADDMTNWAFGRLVGTNVTGLLTHLGVVFTGAVAGTFFFGGPELIGVLLGGAIVLGAVIMLVELFMRMVGIYLGLAFVPVAAIGFVNPHTQGWIHRLAQIEIGLIMLKPALFLVLGIGAAMLSASPTSVDPQGATGLVAFAGGLVVILLAVFTPYYLMKFVPWAEAGIASAVSVKAQSVAGAPLREGSRRLGDNAMTRFGSRIPGLRPRAALPAVEAAAGAAATGGGTVVVRAANVVVRRAGDVPKLADSGGRRDNASVARQPVHSGPPPSVVRPVTTGSKQAPKPPRRTTPAKPTPPPITSPKERRP